MEPGTLIRVLSLSRLWSKAVNLWKAEQTDDIHHTQPIGICLHYWPPLARDKMEKYGGVSLPLVITCRSHGSYSPTNEGVRWGAEWPLIVGLIPRPPRSHRVIRHPAPERRPVASRLTTSPSPESRQSAPLPSAHPRPLYLNKPPINKKWVAEATHISFHQLFISVLFVFGAGTCRWKGEFDKDGCLVMRYNCILWW